MSRKGQMPRHKTGTFMFGQQTVSKADLLADTEPSESDPRHVSRQIVDGTIDGLRSALRADAEATGFDTDQLLDKLKDLWLSKLTALQGMAAPSDLDVLADVEDVDVSVQAAAHGADTEEETATDDAELPPKTSTEAMSTSSEEDEPGRAAAALPPPPPSTGAAKRKKSKSCKKSRKSSDAIPQTDGPADGGDSSEDLEDDDDDDDDDDDVDDDDDAVGDDDDDEQGVEEEPLGSEDDISDEDPSDLFDTENVVVCQYDKITRQKNKWKFHLKDGIMNLNGKDYVFQRAAGDADW